MQPKSVYALLLLSATATASPSPVEKRSFKVERVVNENFSGFNGPHELAKAYRKYSMPMPDGLEDAVVAQRLAKRRNVFSPPNANLGMNAAAAGNEDNNRNNGNAGNNGGSVVIVPAGNGGGTIIIGGNGQVGNQNGNKDGNKNGNKDGNKDGKKDGKKDGNKNGNKDGNKNGGNRGGQIEGNNGARNGTEKGQKGGKKDGQKGQDGKKGQNGQNGQKGKKDGKGKDKGGKGGKGGNAGNKNSTDIANPANGNGQQTGVVAAQPEANDKEFLSKVKVGGQEMTLDFDTGSSDLWVFNTQLDQQTTQGHAVFDPKKSTSFKELQGAQFSISYGDGSGAAGNVGTDTVDIGGAVVNNQAIELATNVSNTFVQDQNNDGLLGLAFSSINTVKPQKQKTFFDNIMPSLAEPVFTADLRKGAAGAYEFGKIDTAKFQGQLQWANINNKKGFWQFSSQAFAVNGGQPQKGAQGGQAIADTGTTLILADPSVVQGYYSQVQGAQNDQKAGGVTVPCNAKLPDLDLDIGGQFMARVKGDDINFAPVGQGRKFPSPLSSFFSSTCTALTDHLYRLLWRTPGYSGRWPRRLR